MARCRIGYLLALAGAWAFLIFFTGHLSLYIFVLALVFPLFSLAVSLPGILGAGVSFDADRRSIRRGQSFTLSLTLENRRKLPVGRLKARVACENLLTGEQVSLRRKGAGGALALCLTADVEELHCGVIRCGVTSLKVCDLLGIFSFRLPLPKTVELLALPLDLPPEEQPTLLGEGERHLTMKPRPGGGPGEDYDLRPYRQGDPLRSVHWKLSSKVDGLVVRETLEPVKVQAVLTYDHFGTPEDLDAAFDRLDAVSRSLIEHERVHTIYWRDPDSGALLHRSISNRNDLRAFEHAVFSTPAPAEGTSLRSAPLKADGPTKRLRRLHIEGAPEKAENGGGAA